MKVIIEGSPEEIAALVLVLQERRGVDLRADISEDIQRLPKKQGQARPTISL